MSVVASSVPEGTVTFASLGLRAELLRALEAAGYSIPTPIQGEAIPAILAGKDVLAAAQTGTGKTAGFTLPILHRLMAEGTARKPKREGNSRGPRFPVRALILTPTRELAAQVADSVRTYGRFLPISSAAVFGGVGMGPQVQALGRGVDILVATPGRLLDHVQQRTVDLSQVEILVLDEADRMLDMGFVRDIRRILPLLQQLNQRLLFSATFSQDIKSLAEGLLQSPTKIEMTPPAEERALIRQTVCHIKQEEKRDFLLHLMEIEKMTQVLVFTRTKHGADRLTKHLTQAGISATAIHSNRSQAQRIQALAEFKSGRVRVLVATDIAARGLDIPQLPHVVNFEVPNAPEDYVHRIGRTGRAGHIGEAISLVSPDERKFLASIERHLGKAVERRSLSGYLPPKRDEVVAETVAEPVAPAVVEERQQNERVPRPPKPRFDVQYPTRSSRPNRPMHHTPRHKRRAAAAA